MRTGFSSSKETATIPRRHPFSLYLIGLLIWLGFAYQNHFNYALVLTISLMAVLFSTMKWFSRWAWDHPASTMSLSSHRFYRSTPVRYALLIFGIGLLGNTNLQLAQQVDQQIFGVYATSSSVTNQQLSNAVQTTPYDQVANLWEREGALLDKQGNPSGAMNAFQTALSLDPTNDTTRLLLATDEMKRWQSTNGNATSPITVMSPAFYPSPTFADWTGLAVFDATHMQTGANQLGPMQLAYAKAALYSANLANQTAGTPVAEPVIAPVQRWLQYNQQGVNAYGRAIHP